MVDGAILRLQIGIFRQKCRGLVKLRVTMVEFRSVILSKGSGYIIHLNGPECLQKDWITKYVILY